MGVSSILSSDDHARRIAGDELARATARERISDVFRIRDAHIVGELRIWLNAEDDAGARAALQNVIDALSQPVKCRACGEPVEEDRVCRPHPRCHTCLPPCTSPPEP